MPKQIRNKTTFRNRYVLIAEYYNQYRASHLKWSVDATVNDVAKKFKVCKMTIYRALKQQKQFTVSNTH